MNEPLTPPECDLQDFPFMPLHVARLRDSDLANQSHPEACWYAVLLWSASWHQLPAASLPDNEIILTRLCGLGRDVKTFRKHREEAMRGFILCSDGRLYHPTVAEQAIAAWESKRQQRWRSELARIKKANQRNATNLPSPTYEEFLAGVSPGPPEPRPQPVPGDTAECPPGQTLQETETGTGISKKEAIASSVGSAEPIPTDPSSRNDLAGKSDPWVKDASFLAAWDACTKSGRTRSSRAKAWAAWKIALRREPGPVLASAMARYVAEDDDAKRTGGPGFHTWLADGRFEHWTGGGTGCGTQPAAWTGPPELRASVVAAKDEDFAKRWLDAYCQWRPGDRTLLAKNAFVAKQLSQELGEWCRRMKVHIDVGPANDPVEEPRMRVA